MNNYAKLKGLKVLLVESDQMIKDLLRSGLLDAGCYLDAVRSAEEGLELVAVRDFDVIISDFDLPTLDGFEFFKSEAIARLAGVKIMISAYGDVDPLTEAYVNGIHVIIEKPFTLRTLLDAIVKHLP